MNLLLKPRFLNARMHHRARCSIPSASLAAAPVAPKPSPKVLGLWQHAEAVCFDVDCTVTTNVGLDLLADFMGVGKECKALIKALDGSMNIGPDLEAQLKTINCKPADVRQFLQENPPESRLSKGIESLIRVLKARGAQVYLISGGFREMVLPIAKHLGIPLENIFANRMLWQLDDETQEPSRLTGMDMSEPTSFKHGKAEAIARIRQRNPYNSVVMIGDGIHDLQAVQVSGGADVFIGYGGAVEKPDVLEASDWPVHNFAELEVALKHYKVAVVGSGAWACAAASLAAQNVLANDPSEIFVDEIKMWVYEEEFQGRKLSQLINETHENPKYLPGVTLGENVSAVVDLKEAVADADMLIMCVPPQYLRNICRQLAGKVKKGAIALSLVNGMRVRLDGPQLISHMITRYLDIECSVLMGGTIAEGVGKGELSEAVIGYDHLESARLFQKLLERPSFHINLLPDVAGAEMCGTLKNIVGLAAGMVDGLGLGPNSKAAIVRVGLGEMKRFSQSLYPSIRDDTFLDSCGIADLVATCIGGRNRLVAFEFTKAWLAGSPVTFEALETSLLGGVKVQGLIASDDVQEMLRVQGWEEAYPLFTTVNRIIHGHLTPHYIVEYKEGAAAKLVPEPESKQAGAEPWEQQGHKYGSVVSLAELELA